MTAEEPATLTLSTLALPFSTLKSKACYSVKKQSFFAKYSVIIYYVTHQMHGHVQQYHKLMFSLLCFVHYDYEHIKELI